MTDGIWISKELKYKVDSIISPEPDPEGGTGIVPPHPRLSAVHKLDTSYYRGPVFVKADKAFERLLTDETDPVHNILETAPYLSACSRPPCDFSEIASSHITNLNAHGMSTGSIHQSS